MTFDELTGDRRGLFDVIQVDASPDFFDPVDDVVQGRRQVADVFAVERGDEGAVQGAEDLVGDLVAGVLDVFEMARLAIHVDAVGEQIVQESRAFEVVLGAAVEQVEKAVILRDEAKSGKHSCSAS